MKLPRNNPKRAARLGVILLFSVLGFLYLYAQTRDVLRGPELAVLSPADGTTVRDPILTVSGAARHIASLSLDGRQIFTDEQGRFRESLLLPAGYSILELEARDTLHRSVRKILRVVYQPYGQAKN